MPYLRASGSGVLSLAAEHGRPVVASAVGPFLELVEDGVAGRLVPPGNPRALSDAIVDALHPDVLAGYEQAIRRGERGMSWEGYARRLLDVIGEGGKSAGEREGRVEEASRGIFNFNDHDGRV
jgi:glycosyltransferase involved in cell wall biosynthesis